MNRRRRFATARTLFTAAAFAILAATGGVPAAHAAPRHAATRAGEHNWLYDYDDYIPHSVGSVAPWWSPRIAAQASAPAGPQPSAVLVPPASDVYYSRGRTVGISGGTALVASAPNTNVLGSAVYVYQGVDTTTGAVSPSARLMSVDGNAGGAGDNFGVSMSLVGGLGLVGAPSFTSSTGYLPKVYVYNNLATATGNVTESAQLRPSDQAGYNTTFGQAVSLSGTTGLVGASNVSNGSTLAGEAYVFRNLNTATGTVTENVRLFSSDSASSGTRPMFGSAVSLSGGTGLVGAYSSTVGSNASQGAAYVFRNLDTASGSITQNVKLVASDGAAQDFFGYSVSQSGNTALVGAYRATATSTAALGPGAAYVFRNLDTASGTMTQSVKLVASDTVGGTSTTASAFGFSVGLSGNTALVGTPGTASGSGSGVTAQGAAYLYRNLDTASGTVTQNVKLVASDGAAGDRFGYSVSLDGDRFVIGAPQFQTSQAGKSYSGSLGSVSTLDLGNTSALISGISFVSQDNWVVGQNTSGNQVTLSAGDTATVNAAGRGVFVGQNAGSNNNTLVIAGTVNANTFTIGATGNTGNTLQLGNGGTTGSLPTSATINNSGILAFNRSNVVAQGTDFNAGPLTGAGGVTQLGTGTTTLNAANTYTGPTTVSAGTLQAGVASVAGTSGAFGNNSAITMGNVSGATLALNSFNTQIGSLTGGGTTGGNVTLGTATLTVGGNNTSPAPYAGSISGTGGLTKIGTGTLTLAGSNPYSGATAVNAGTLAVNGALTGTGTLTVASGAALAGTGTVAGAVTVTGGTFAPGQLSAGKLTLGNSLTLSGTTTAAFTLASTGSTQAAVAGQVNLGTTATLSLSLATGYTPAAGTKFFLIDETGTSVAILGSFANAPTTGSQFTQNGYVFSINYLDRDPTDTSNALLNDVSVTVVGVVPEPSTWAMFGLGVAGLSVAALRRRQRVA